MPHSKLLPSSALISIAGTVGVGKSTLTKLLAQKLNFKTSMEKVDGNPYLEDYYSDFKTWSFHLQIYFLAERFKEQKRMFESNWGFVQDRTIYEDVGIFARLQYDNGNMTQRDFETYQSLFEAMTMSPFFPSPTLIIYLEGSFERILERIHRRGRDMETKTPISFWEELYGRYEKWIGSLNVSPVLRLNIDRYDFIKNPEDIDEVVRLISEKINEPSLAEAKS